jgi:Raf kinase inhibitor-like YbhB/YbcL family protein
MLNNKYRLITLFSLSCLVVFRISLTIDTFALGGNSMELKSPAFGEGDMIPKKYTCDGQDISPPVEWTSVIKGAQTLALICDDPDAPGGTWVHWVIFNLPNDTKNLAENIPHLKELPNGAKQGTNDFGKIGYGGPCPPGGTHRYYFKIYSLDTDLDLEAGATKAQLLQAIEGHILEEGQLMGKYKRQ